MDKNKSVRWLAEPVSGDYDAAQNFLELLYKAKKAR
jgi:hypothetical protein